MGFIAAAVIGSAIVGGVVSSKASKRAAGAAKDSSDAQLAFQEKQGNIARGDINRLFPQAAEERAKGSQNAMNFMSQGLPMTMDMQQQGNIGAQNILAGSMPQIQNAIMGGQVNYDFMQPQKINYQDQLQGLLSGMPELYNEEANSQATQNATANQPQQYPTTGNFRPSYNSGNIFGGMSRMNQGQQPAPLGRRGMLYDATQQQTRLK